MTIPVATEEQTIAMARKGATFAMMAADYTNQIAELPDMRMFATMLATGQAVDAFMLAALFHPEWAQAHLGPLMTDENARATADRIVARLPVEGRAS